MHPYQECHALQSRTGKCGGSLENRMRFPLEIFEAMGAAFPPAKPTGVQELQKAVTRLAKANQAPRRADTNRRKRTRKGADRENCRRAPTTVRYAVTPGAKADAVFLERSDHLSNSGPDRAVFFTDGSILVDGKTFGIITGLARDDTSAALCTIGPSDPSCRCNSILRSLELFGRARVQAYCAMPLPKDQFSFFTSTRLMKTSSRLSLTRSCSPSATAL
jgi:hypothetical protein